MPPLGLGYISAAAKKHGCDCVIHDAWLLDQSPEEAAASIRVVMRTRCVSAVGVQLFHDTVAWAAVFVRSLRGYGAPLIIVGGPLVTVLGDQARRMVGADVGIAGEFDNGWDAHTIDALADATGRTVARGKTDVNATPIPDWGVMNLPQYWPYLYQVSTPVRGERIGVVQRTRGCPFHCTFCAAGATMGHNVRFRDDANVLEEIRYLRDRWDIDEVWFQDDNVIVSYERGISLFEKLAPLGLHVRLPAGVRWENVDVHMAAAMRAAGVYFTGIGIESGNPRVLRRIKKSVDQPRLKTAIETLTGYGINTIGFFIFGLPTETREEMEDTVAWAMGTKLHHAQFGTFIPYPGAEDADESSTLPNAELVKIQRNATLRFYLRPRIIWNMLKHFRWSQLRAIWNHPWVQRWVNGLARW
jgi:radical SAM superfamily enzyme YgiQ (UPF0313 family)